MFGSKKQKAWIRDHYHQVFFAVIWIFFLLLLARNPFSTRNLIPNLEPFPDTFHYIVPARALLNGQGLSMVRIGKGFIPSVPPLYTFFLVPIYFFLHDVRSYYFLNVALACVALYLFIKVVKLLRFSRPTQLLLTFFFAANAYVTWYPQWAMAENLVLPLSLLGIFFLLSPSTRKKAFFAGFIPISFYMTKIALGPVAIVFALALLVKYWRSFAIVFISATVLISSALLYGDYLSSGRNPFGSIVSVTKALLGEAKTTPLSQVVATQPTTKWFSSTYLPKGLTFYWNSFLGAPTTVLWEHMPAYPIWIGVLGILGMIVGCVRTKSRWSAIVFIALLAGETVFMSTFYAYDLRYVYFIIPLTIIGVGWLLEACAVMLRAYTYPRYTWNVVVLILALAFLGASAIRLKSQVMINLKYAETPWWYISVRQTNEFMEVQSKKEPERPILISAIPPFFYDFYSDNSFDLLPLTPQQEFRSNLKEVWGPYDYSDVLKLYADMLKQHRVVYTMKYGLGNEAVLIQAWENLEKNFKLTPVQPGCYDLCTIYKVEMKK